MIQKSVAARNLFPSPSHRPRAKLLTKRQFPFFSGGGGGEAVRRGARWPEGPSRTLDPKSGAAGRSSASLGLQAPQRWRSLPAVARSQPTPPAAPALYLALKVSLEAASSKFARPGPPGRSWGEVGSCCSPGLPRPP